MRTALIEPGPEIEPLEQLLEDDQSTERSQPLAGSEFDAWNLLATGVDTATGNVHKWWPFVWGFAECGNNALSLAEGRRQPLLTLFSQSFNETGRLT